MITRKTEQPNPRPTTSERVQLAVGIAINDAINAVIRLARRIRSLGQ